MFKSSTMLKVFQYHLNTTLAIALAAAATGSIAETASAQAVTAPGTPAARAVPEDVSLPLDALFRDLRSAYARDATADKIAVTVRERDRMPQTATLTVRQGWVVVREEVKPPSDPSSTPTTAPEAGTPAASPPAPSTPPAEVVERRVRAISVDAGDLRLHLLGRTLTVTLASNQTTYFTTEVEDGPISSQLTRLIGPLPLVPLILADWRDADAFPPLVPQVDRPGTSWFKAVTRLDPPGSPITLLGSTPFGPMSMQIDGRTFRPTQALASVSPAPRSTVMELELTPREPGDPGKWAPSLEGRTRVGAISLLARRVAPERSPSPEPTDAKPGVQPVTPEAKPEAPALEAPVR